MRNFFVIAIVTLAVVGCTARPPSPKLGAIYNRSAQYHGPERNPVIVIPGILGSKLVDRTSGRVGWGAFSGDYADPRTPAGLRIAALPMRPGVPLSELRDEVEADGVLESVRVNLLGLPVEQKAYVQILQTLGAGGYRDEQIAEELNHIDYGPGHYSCFQFAYDWRRDLAENAAKLHEFIEEKARYVREQRRKEGHGDADVKFDIVAHSMGGLLARYYLRYGDKPLPDDDATSLPAVTWKGVQRVDRAILVGTPNAGSVQALDNLIRGKKFAPTLPTYEAALLGTMPGVYQLLPRPRHGNIVDEKCRPIDCLDPQVWESRQWGLASPRQDRVLKLLLPAVPNASERRKIALDHQRKCLIRARQLAEALDRETKAPPSLDLRLIAGDAINTAATIRVAKDGNVRYTRGQPGDGTVTRASALLDERDERDPEKWSPHLVSPIAWGNVTFLFTDHLGLTTSPAFTDNVLYTLLEEPR